MRLIKNDENLKTIEQVRQFLEGSEGAKFKGITVGERYDWIGGMLVRFRYIKLNKAGKRVIKRYRYTEEVGGYSRAQLARLKQEYKRKGKLRKAQYKRDISHSPLPKRRRMVRARRMFVLLFLQGHFQAHFSIGKD